jgi:hypothetical protein
MKRNIKLCTDVECKKVALISLEDLEGYFNRFAWI